MEKTQVPKELIDTDVSGALLFCEGVFGSAHVLTRMAEGLRPFATHDCERAAVRLATAAPQVSRLGGSRAQDELCELVAQKVRWRAEGTSVFRSTCRMRRQYICSSRFVNPAVSRSDQRRGPAALEGSTP